MAALKDLSNKIRSVKSSLKITKAMKVVAASKLKKAKEAITSNRPYADRITNLLKLMVKQVEDKQKFSLLFEKQEPISALIISVSSDRGMCGAFNSNIAKATHRLIYSLKSEGKHSQVLCIGKKAFDLINFGKKNNNIILHEKEQGFTVVDDVQNISHKILEQFHSDEIDEVHIIYNKFNSAVSQEVVNVKLLPVDLDETEHEEEADKNKNLNFLCEPEPKKMLETLIPDFVVVNILKSILENSASEHGARMTAMDNASRNAEDIIKKLTVKYNRTRQAAITTELIEVISGSEAINDG